MKLKYIIAAALVIGTTASCSDFLDQDNKSSVPASNFYNTKGGFESLTNSCTAHCAAYTKCRH